MGRGSQLKKKVCRLRVRDRVLTQVEEFKYVRVLFMSDDRVEQDTDRLTGVKTKL